MESKLGYTLRDKMVYRSDYGPTDFRTQFHAFKGNAFGHANLLSQSLSLKPSMDSRVTNMVFAGHLTHPGPGVPPALVSGNVAAALIHSKLHPVRSTVSSVSRVIRVLFLWVVTLLILCA